MWMSQRIHSVGTSARNPDRVVETPSHRPFAKWFAQPSRYVIPDDRKGRGRWFQVTRQSCPEGRGTVTGIAVERLHHPTLRGPHLDTAEHTVREHRWHDSFGAIHRRWHEGRFDPGAFELQLPLAERSVDCEDLASFDPTDRPSLGDLLAGDSKDHFELEGGPRLGERQVLGSCPCSRAS